MIRIYIDWNVIVHMKTGQHSELLELLKRKDQSAVIYSTSHISDIMVSHNGDPLQDKRIEDDLYFIRELTNNYCAHISDKEVYISPLDPHRLFVDRIYSKETTTGAGPLADALNMFEEGTKEYEAIKIRIESPLPEPISTILNDPTTAERFDALYPGLRDYPTLGNLVRIGWLKNKALTDTDSYKNLRSSFQDCLGLNRDKMFATPDPFNDVNKIHTELEQLSGTPINELVENNNSPNWYRAITHNYLMLDMHGYQQDKIKVSERNKDTMRNTIDDALHAGFASTCDFYITNDKRSLNKTRQVYQKLGLNTRVLTADEFVTYASQSLMNFDPPAHLSVWLNLLNQPGYHEEVVDDAVWRTYFLEFYLFDYFNKVSVVFASEEPIPIIVLHKEKPTNFKFITEYEIQAIIHKLDIAFEASRATVIDLSQNTLTEGFKCNWPYKDVTFRLQLLSGYLQLYMDLPESVKQHE